MDGTSIWSNFQGRLFFSLSAFSLQSAPHPCISREKEKKRNFHRNSKHFSSHERAKNRIYLFCFIVLGSTTSITFTILRLRLLPTTSTSSSNNNIQRPTSSLTTSGTTTNSSSSNSLDSNSSSSNTAPTATPPPPPPQSRAAEGGEATPLRPPPPPPPPPTQRVGGTPGATPHPQRYKGREGWGAHNWIWIWGSLNHFPNWIWRSDVIWKKRGGGKGVRSMPHKLHIFIPIIGRGVTD